MSEREIEERPSPSRPRPWQWLVASLVAAGPVASAVALNILSDLVKERLGQLWWAIVLVAVAAAGPFGFLTVREIRSRLANQRVAAEQRRPMARRQRVGVVTEPPTGTALVGREPELAWLERRLVTERVVVLFGRSGVGTSTCVIHAAGRMREPGRAGPRYLDLRPGRRPLRPARVLAAVSGLLSEPVLLVLDNVTSPTQIRPLLRHLHGCRLLVAGGPKLGELDGVTKRRLAEPPREEAAALFLRAVRDIAPGGGPVAGRDPRTDPTLGSLVDICGRQPAAVRALAYRMAIRGWSAEDLLAMLRTHLARGTWQPGRRNATLSLLLMSDRAYAALRRPARRLYRLLSLAPQPLSRNEAAALAGLARRRADRALAELAAGSFVDSEPDDRYRIRPLLADYGLMHLQLGEPVGRRTAALGRLLAQLAGRAERYAAMLYTGARPRPVLLGADPHAWFARREAPLKALVCRSWGAPGGLPHRPPARLRRRWVRLAVALCGWYAARRDLDGWAAVCEAVLETPAARRPAVAGWAYNDLGVVRRQQGDLQAAASELSQAVALRPRQGAAQSRTNLGLVLLGLGDVNGAIDHLQRARRQRSRRDRGGQALTDLGLGAAFLGAGDPAQARHHLVVAANGFDTLGDRRGYAAALANLVLAQWWLGERLDAAHAWRHALECCESVDDPEVAAAALLNAGATLLAGTRPDPERARRHIAQSLHLRAGQPNRRGRALLYLGDAAELLRGPAAAQHRWRAAARTCERVGDRAGLEAALARLAR